MSRKYPKKVRNEFKRKLAAADAFVEAWTTSELSYRLIPDYDCTLGCEEAMTYADLFKSFGYTNTAEQILADHGESCETPHYHEPQGVWTFDITAGGPAVENVDDPEWTIVADGKDGAEAEDRALTFLKAQLKKKYPGHLYLRVDDVESGVPGSFALYHWTDIRKAA
ncbi:hypothetical protein [Streptomyces sp. NBC_01751]|uniref:hypothetical protein n=1 Tax=Streptomyces sp. NBC_01751 TaxID=2975929 RepID=UPI002DDADC76|nr:hypothetical protein [Streptomyces sp. NBC_01751]WSD24569.1 hypothetical protein OHA26_14340 [Streptomyces sp. NBC_01751]